MNNMRSIKLYKKSRIRKSKLPDYEGYRLDKRTIESLPLTPKVYEQLTRQAAAMRGI